MRTVFSYIIIIALLFVLVLQTNHCNNSDECYSDTTYVTRIIPGDSFLIPYPEYTYIPVTSVKIDTFLQNVDTSEIISYYFQNDGKQLLALLSDHYSINYYTDTIRHDSDFVAVIQDSVQANEIISRYFLHRNLKETAIHQTNINKAVKKNSFFIGPFARSPTGFGFGGSLLWENKKNRALSYSYDFINNNHYVSYYFKLNINAHTKIK